MVVSREIRLNEFLIAGTDDDVSNMYRELPERARELQFGLVEDEVVVLDTETTGLNPSSCSLLEIAAIRMARGETVDSFQTFVDPDAPFQPKLPSSRASPRQTSPVLPPRAKPSRRSPSLRVTATSSHIMPASTRASSCARPILASFQGNGLIRSRCRKSSCRASNRIGFSTLPPHSACRRPPIARWTTPLPSAPCGAYSS